MEMAAALDRIAQLSLASQSISNLRSSGRRNIRGDTSGMHVIHINFANGERQRVNPTKYEGELRFEQALW